MNTYCGIDCNQCGKVSVCKGCISTFGHPFGGQCIAAECIKKNGCQGYINLKHKIIDEFNALNIQYCPEITDLFELSGSMINMEYDLGNGVKIKLLNDKNIYLGNQVKKSSDDNRFYGFAADEEHLLVCEYDLSGNKPEIVLYKKD